jgi:hypothetical protein
MPNANVTYWLAIFAAAKMTKYLARINSYNERTAGLLELISPKVSHIVGDERVD